MNKSPESQTPNVDYRVIFNATSHAMVFTDLAGRIVEVNDAWVRATKISREIAVTHAAPDLDIWASSLDRDFCKSEVQARGQIHDFESNLIIGGRERTHLISARSVLVNGQTFVLWEFRDVTELRQINNTLLKSLEEQKLAKEALLEREARIRSISNNLTAGMIYQVVIRTDGIRRFTYLSDSVLTLYGITPEQGMENPDLIYGCVHADDIDALKKREDEAARTLSTFKAEIRVKPPSGTARWSSLVSTPRLLADGSTCWDGIEFVITERKEAELEREKLIADLSGKNAELERFTYTVSHDLKSPLVTIRSFLGFLAEDVRGGNPEQMQQDIRRIIHAADRMQELLEDLLELARVGRTLKGPEKIEFADLVQEVVEILQGQINARAADLRIQKQMPAVYGDRRRLVEALQNLVDNAVKYSANQAHPVIEIGHRRSEGKMAAFFVKDNGMGIAPEHQDSIFGLFEKVDPASAGTGVGLALVKRIIELHGGSIRVESDGNGSTFHFTLPGSPI